jgi:hypothetical protein
MSMAQTNGNSRYTVSKACQANVRKQGRRQADSLDEERLKINLGHLVDRLSVNGKVSAYEQIANEISELAGRSDRPWTWRAVRNTIAGTSVPGKKFLSALGLLLEDINPRKKQWFYFTRRRAIAAVFEKSIMREQIVEHMRALGFRAVTFSRYMQVKNRAVHR